MNDEKRMRFERELQEDAERIMAEVNKNPDLKDVTVPPELHDQIFQSIREYEEERELIRLGRIYKRKRKNRKYLVLAAAMVLALAFGITSIGGAERVLEILNITNLGREQTQMNSNEGIKFDGNASEEEAYAEIEEKFGFLPVKLEYRPAGIEFKEALVGDDTYGILMIYGRDDSANIVYFIRPNYRLGSFGTDVEDKLLEKYNVEINSVEFDIKKYQVEETQAERWTAEFLYEDVGYFLMVSDIGQEEFENILYNLQFV